MPYLQVVCYDRDLLIHSVPICATCPRTRHRHSVLHCCHNYQARGQAPAETHPLRTPRERRTLVRSLAAALGSVIDPGLSLFLTHFPKVSSSLAMNVTSRPEKILQLPSMAPVKAPPNTQPHRCGWAETEKKKKTLFFKWFSLKELGMTSKKV